jgi:target of rapamycin complex subunit LST8
MIQNRDATSLVPICKFSAHDRTITRVLLSPDVRHLATCSADHTARIWSVETGVGLAGATGALSLSGTATPNNPPGAPSGNPPPATAATTNGGTTTTNGTNGSAANIDASTSLETDAFPLEMTLEGHQRWVWDCAFSADSAYLVTACSDHYARLWELSSQSIIRQYNGHHRGTVCVALNDTALS